VYVCVCMCMYVYVCVCMCMYVYVCVCMCMYVYACVCMCMHVYVCVCMCMYVYVCVCMCMYVYACVCMCMYVYVCVCMGMHVYVRVTHAGASLSPLRLCTYVYISTCACVRQRCVFAVRLHVRVIYTTCETKCFTICIPRARSCQSYILYICVFGFRMVRCPLGQVRISRLRISLLYILYASRVHAPVSHIYCMYYMHPTRTHLSVIYTVYTICIARARTCHCWHGPLHAPAPL